jgi:hypothetical protein
VTPIVGQIVKGFSIKDLKINKHEVDEAFIASFRQLSDPKVTGYTQFRIQGTAGIKGFNLKPNIRPFSFNNKPDSFNDTPGSFNNAPISFDTTSGRPITNLTFVIG